MTVIVCRGRCPQRPVELSFGRPQAAPTGSYEIRFVGAAFGRLGYRTVNGGRMRTSAPTGMTENVLFPLPSQPFHEIIYRR